MDAMLGDKFSYSLKALEKHFVCLGSTGSGKTVLSKILIEEAALQGIPSIVIDPQGDLASLGIIGESDKVDSERAALFKEKVNVTVFTPTSSKGIPLCANPLKPLPKNIEKEELVSILNQTSTSIAKLIGFDTGKDKGKNAQSVLYLILMDAWKRNIRLKTFDQLSEIVLNLPESVLRDGAAFVKDKKEIENLAKKLKYLTIGEKELMFQYGVPIDIDLLLGKKNDKTQVSIIYLNTLESMDDKQFFVSMLATELYKWMILHPSKSLQALFMIDEVAQYLPAGSEKPIAKDILRLVYKQARKYGVGCITGTQNPGDIDYKAFAQFGTWALGRMVTKQDIAKVSTALKSLTGNDISSIMSKLPALKPGEFKIFCPDLFKSIEDMKARWLLTEHRTLTEDDVRRITSNETREHYAPYMAVKAALNKDAKKEAKHVKGIGVLHFLINVSREEAQTIVEKKKKKMFVIFGKDRENVESMGLVAVPFLRIHAFAVKKGLFKDKTERFTLYFDAVEGNLAVLDVKGHIEFFDTSKLLSLNETELRVLKSIIEMKENATHAKISSRLGITETAVNDSANSLMKKHLISFSGRKKEKGRAYTWQSVPMKLPMKLKKTVSEQIEVDDSKEEWHEARASVTERDVVYFLRTWLNAGIEQAEIVYYPYYEAKLVGKKKRRLLKISAVNGKEIG
ncbi:MAG: helicase HerA-like domain-containing protein [Nanoarchaeota archaeon]